MVITEKSEDVVDEETKEKITKDMVSILRQLKKEALTETGEEDANIARKLRNFHFGKSWNWR